jgi:hypothetical protein
VNISRRKFLAAAAGAGAAAAVNPLAGAAELVHRTTGNTTEEPSRNRKLIVVLFGGGTRSSESIDDSEHRYIPLLWNRMVPKGALFTNMRVEHKVVHPNCAGSIMTGHWEWDDNEWSRPVANPTIFEVYRKAHKASDTSAWAFVYASILANTGQSLSPDYGISYAANVVTPPTIQRTTADQIANQMAQAAKAGSTDAEIEATKKCARLACKSSQIWTAGLHSKRAIDFIENEHKSWMREETSTSHDAFLAERAIACMRKFAPDVMSVCFGEIDCAHYGSWSRYVDAIRRTDELTWRIWRTAEQLDDYRGRTLMLILPDHGRELDRDGHWGFIHHSNFYTNQNADEGCRRVWMLVLGPGVSAGHRIESPVPITAAAATGLEYLDLEAPSGAESSVWNLIGNR